MNEERYDLFESYYSGALSEVEARTFEERIKQEEDLRHEYEAWKEMQDFLSVKPSADQAKLDIQKSREEYEISQAKSQAKPKSNLRWLIPLTAAASVLILLYFLIPHHTTPAHKRLFAEYYVLEKKSANLGPDDEARVKRGYELYNEEKYAEAIPLLDTTGIAPGDQGQVMLALGTAQYQVGQYKFAKSTLEYLTDYNPFMRDSALWQLALSALKQNKLQETLDYLAQLSPESNNREKADRLTADIQKVLE